MSYVHPRASFLTPDTIRLGVNVGPDENERRSVCPVARILTEVPPTSTTSTFLAEDVFATRARFCRPVRRWAVCRDFAFTALARSPEHSRFGADYTHQVVPGIGECLGAFVLKPARQGTDVDPRRGKPRQLLFGIAAICGHRLPDLAVFGERLQRA